MWPCALSGRLPISAMVGLYPTIQLISRGLLSRRFSPFTFRSYAVLAPVSQSYSPPRGRLPTCYSPVRHFTQGLLPFLVRLACVKRAASVDSEPGSNSRLILQSSLQPLLSSLLDEFSLSTSPRQSLASARGVQSDFQRSVPAHRISFELPRTSTASHGPCRYPCDAQQRPSGPPETV